MIKRILAVTILLFPVFILGCSGTSDLTAYPKGISLVANNMGAILLSTSAPDLIIETIEWSPENPSKEDVVTFTVTIKNQGSGKAFPTRVYFYVDNSHKADQQVDMIEAGNLVTKTFTWAAEEGSHIIRVTVDEGKTVSESDETNNEKTVTVVTLSPDLLIQDITWSPTSPVEGDNMTFTVTIKNQGTGRADNSPVGYYIDDTYLAFASPGPIDPGSTISDSTFSWIAEAGSHTIMVFADPFDKVTESDETNNEKTLTLPTFAPDLIVENIAWSPTNPEAGDNITFTVTIKNQGSGKAFPTRVYFYIGDFSRESQDIESMAAGNLVTRTFTWTAKAGSYTIKATIDEEKRIPESDETNNNKTITFSGVSPSDLIIQDIAWSPADPSIGEAITLTVTIKNQGSGKTENFSVACYVDDILLAFDSVSPMDPGETDNSTFTWTAEAGSHTITAVADSHTQVIESNEKNNEKAIIYPVPPDVIVQEITWSPEKPLIGKEMSFTVTIKNQGSSKAEEFSIACYVDDTYLTLTSINPIDAGATVNSTFTWTAEAGSHRVKVVADSLNKVTESDETNNESTEGFSVFLPSPSTPESTTANTTDTEAHETPVAESKPIPSPEKEGWPISWFIALALVVLVGLIIGVWKLRQRQK